MKLLLIYNANSGKLNALLDAGHKLLSHSTYPCSLCALTYDTFSENSTWKNFRLRSDLTMEFLHKDEFETQFPNVKVIYPTILKLEENLLSTILTQDTLNEISTVEELIKKIEAKINL